MNRIRDILSLPVPREHAASIFDIDYERLKILGIKTLLFDYDNTLAPWKSINVNEKTLNLFNKLLTQGFKLCVVTNAPENRACGIKERFGKRVPIFGCMRKPGVNNLGKVIRSLNTQPEEAVIIGDLFFTDIIAGNRMKMLTILVNPYTPIAEEVRTLINSAAIHVTKFFYRIYFYTIGWFFRLADLVSPNEFEKDIYSINYEKFKKADFEAIIFDFDNTISVWKSKQIPLKALDLFKTLHDMGFKIFILSNTVHLGRLISIQNSAKVPVIVAGRMRKPLSFKIKKILTKYRTLPSKTVFVGDQLFTDIFAGNTLKNYTIKIEPINKDREFCITKILRKLEKRINNYLKNKPKI